MTPIWITLTDVQSDTFPKLITAESATKSVRVPYGNKNKTSVNKEFSWPTVNATGKCNKTRQIKVEGCNQGLQM